MFEKVLKKQKGRRCCICPIKKVDNDGLMPDKCYMAGSFEHTHRLGSVWSCTSRTKKLDEAANPCGFHGKRPRYLDRQFYNIIQNFSTALYGKYVYLGMHTYL